MSKTDPASIPEHVVEAMRHYKHTGHDRLAIAAALDALFTDEPIVVLGLPEDDPRLVNVLPADVLAAVLERNK